MGKVKDLTGQKFGRLTVLERAKNNTRGQSMWRCKCDCGNTWTGLGTSLISGNTQSCGCLAREMLIKRNTVHSLHGTRLYGIWVRMRQRCNDENCTDYISYGARGIAICKDWDDYRSFHRWALANGYKDNLTIERIDVNGNYEPNNCKWISPAAQARNKTNNHKITYNGQTKTLAEWAEILGIKSSLLRYRLRNWGVERAFTTPIRRQRDAASNS